MNERRGKEPLGYLAAVDHVQIQAPQGMESELKWFYGQLIGLQQAADGRDGDDAVLRFKSQRLHLRIRVCETPSIERVDHRVHCEVASLEAVARALDDRKVIYRWIRGLQYTDRALSLLDPAGNRVMIRRRWGRY